MNNFLYLDHTGAGIIQDGIIQDTTETITHIQIVDCLLLSATADVYSHVTINHPFFDTGKLFYNYIHSELVQIDHNMDQT